jgi:hypothetical protein
MRQLRMIVMLNLALERLVDVPPPVDLGCAGAFFFAHSAFACWIRDSLCWYSCCFACAFSRADIDIWW